MLDENVSWVNHISCIESKISKNIGILYKCSKTLESQYLLSLYSSLILPYLNYCSTIWGNNKKCRLNILTKLQKKAIRHVAKVGSREQTSPLFNRFNVLKLCDIIQVNMCVLMFRIIKGCVLPNLKTFTLTNDIYQYEMRRLNSIFIFLVKPVMFSIKHVGAKMCNSPK